jgi:hypothetical protein
MRQTYSTQLAIVTGILILFIAGTFALVQSPEVLVSPAITAITVGQAVPHPIEGHENCDSCHGRNGMKIYPVNHLGWKNESCVKCHRP